MSGSNEVSELLKELEGLTKKGGAIKSGMIHLKLKGIKLVNVNFTNAIGNDK